MSSLSAASAVFVPGKYWQPSNTETTETGVVEFVPGQPWAGGDCQTNEQQQWSSTSEEEQNYCDSSAELPIVIMVRNTLYNLGMNPGLFMHNMMEVVEMLNAMVSTDDELAMIADVIFEQSVADPNFRYTGARTCNYLHLNLKLPDLVNFRSLINQRVKDVVVRREDMAKDPDQMERLHGATMFLAELFLNTNLQSQGSQRMYVYRKALEEVMDTLINNASTGNLKCLGKLLKLTGKDIEQFDIKRLEPDQEPSSKQLNDIVNKARLIVINGTVDRSVRELWLQLIELRATRWGLKAAVVSLGGSGGMPAQTEPGSGTGIMAGGDAASSSASNFNSEPVFYNLQGQVITAAEAGYEDEYDYREYAEYQQYDEYPTVDPYTEYDLDPSHYQDDNPPNPTTQDPNPTTPNPTTQEDNPTQDYADHLDELDAEIQAAFSDFLIETNQETS